MFRVPFLATLQHFRRIWPTACRNFCSVIWFLPQLAANGGGGNLSWRHMLKSSTVWHVIYSPPIRTWLKFKAWYIMAEIIDIPAISDVFCVVLRGVVYNQTCRQCAPWLVGGAAYVSWGPWSHSANQVLGCDLCSFDNVSPALPASYPFSIFGHLSASWRRAY